MKKRTITTLAAVLALTCVAGTSSIASSAQEALVLTRDAEGNITVGLEEVEDEAPAVLTQEEGYTYYSSRGYVMESVSHGEGDTLRYHMETTGAGFYAITDGTPLPLTHSFENPCAAYLVPKRDENGEPVLDENGEMAMITQPARHEAAVHGTAIDPTNAYYPTNAEEVLAQYGENAQLYYKFGMEHPFPNTNYTLMKENPHILDVFIGYQVGDAYASSVSVTIDMNNIDLAEVNEILDKYAEQLKNKESVELSDEDLEKIDSAYDSFEKDMLGDLYDELQAFNTERDAWKKSFDEWRDSIDYENMTFEERAASREAAGIMSEWELFLKAKDLTDRINARYRAYCAENDVDATGDIARMGFLASTLLPRTDTIRLGSVWDRFMDANMDHTLDASDAAQILDIASRRGANANSPLSHYFDNLDFDSNRDVDASDAANLLVFLAEKGSGKADDIRTFYKAY